MARTLTLNKTYAQMQSLISGSLLDTQTFYKITDRGDRGLLFRAAAVDRLENDGIRYMLCPATYATGMDAYDNDWIGVWNATKQATATTGQLTIWNGLVWTAGAILSGDSPDTEASGWTVIPKASFTNHEYIEMIFGVTYDFENDWINKQWDENGNEFGLNKTDYNNYEEPDDPEVNAIDFCDWNYATIGNSFFYNKCSFVYNNSNGGNIIMNIMSGSPIKNNSNDGDISHNSCQGIYWNSNGSSIINNINQGSINNNSNSDNISSNTNQGSIRNNSNVGAITSNNNNCDISDNSNNGVIGNNSNRTSINLNTNNGRIEINSNNGAISENSNNGDINLNSNNGAILANSSLPETTCHIQYNTNNGSITGVWDADVTDAVVDKIGTADVTTTLP